MRLIDADALKRKAQKLSVEAWKTNRVARVHNVLNQFIEWIDGAPTIDADSKWIPVSEGLPKKGESVLVTLNDDILSEWEHRDVNYVEIAWYDEKTDYYDGLHFFDSEWEKLDTVTAWMPLPKPYEEEK